MRPNGLLPSSVRPLDNPHRRTRRGRRLLVILGLTGALWVCIAPLAARFLIVRTGPSSGDIIVVLSGSAVYTERLQYAASLYHQARAPAIVLTNDGLAGRWSRQQQRNPRSIERGRDLLVALGIPGDHIVMLPQRVHSTFDEAVAVSEYARAQRLRSVVIVTSAYHARRAIWIFNRVLAADSVSVGIDPVPAGDQSPTPAMWWLSARGWQNVGAEYPKFAYYVTAYR
jgi:uncharacterized SAM-binding protein YcdF (DUF218 family)